MEALSYAQKQRLSYIDFKLLFTGTVTRNEIVNHFKLGVAAASRDLSQYKELTADNMVYDHAIKKYFITECFKPLFEHEPALALTKLANQIGDGVDTVNDMPFPVVSPSKLNVPNLFIVAKVTQAIINKKVLRITYVSLSSGETTREIVPHTLVDTR